MRSDAERTCDVCYREIKDGEKYIAQKIAKSQDPYFLDEREVDSQGNVQLDICLDCRTITGMSGPEVVN